MSHIAAGAAIWMSTIACLAHVTSMMTIGGAEPKLHALMQTALLDLFGIMLIAIILEHIVVTVIVVMASVYQDYRKSVIRMATLELGKEKIVKYTLKDGRTVGIFPAYLVTDEPEITQPAPSEAAKPDVSAPIIELNCSSIADNKTTPSVGSSVDFSVDDKGDISAAVTVANE
jgi:uncharacterized membrane protein